MGTKSMHLTVEAWDCDKDEFARFAAEVQRICKEHRYEHLRPSVTIENNGSAEFSDIYVQTTCSNHNSEQDVTDHADTSALFDRIEIRSWQDFGTTYMVWRRTD